MYVGFKFKKKEIGEPFVIQFLTDGFATLIHKLIYIVYRARSFLGKDAKNIESCAGPTKKGAGGVFWGVHTDRKIGF